MLSSFLQSYMRCGTSLTTFTKPLRSASFRNTMRTRAVRQFSTETPRFHPIASRVSLAKGAAFGAVGLGITTYLANRSFIYCEPLPVNEQPPRTTSPPQADDIHPPPQSAVSLYELTFGTVAGICAGVFIKKGAKAGAFLLGGIFVLLQYLVSFSVVKVDWGRMAFRFENVFYTTDAKGSKKSPTVYSLFNWLVNFLLADFQPRASFLAGLVLGLRIG